MENGAGVLADSVKERERGRKREKTRTGDNKITSCGEERKFTRAASHKLLSLFLCVCGAGGLSTNYIKL